MHRPHPQWGGWAHSRSSSARKSAKVSGRRWRETPKRWRRRNTVLTVGEPTSENIYVAGSESSVAARHSLSLQYLWNARHSARLCAEGEADSERRRYYEVRGHSMTAVISAAAFVETIVNEVFQDVADYFGRAGLSDGTVETMRVLWKGEEFDKAGSVLLKYQVALAAAGQPLMNSGRESLPGRRTVDKAAAPVDALQTSMATGR